MGIALEKIDPTLHSVGLNDILLSDFTRNLVVVGRQPHPDPNFASYVSSGRPHRLAVALPHAA